MKFDDQVARAISLVKQYGYEEAGQTPTDTFRLPTIKCPLFGGCGGERITMGGRKRFVKDQTHFCTIGKRTVCFYSREGDELRNFVNIPTRDADGIKEHLAKISG